MRMLTVAMVYTALFLFMKIRFKRMAGKEKAVLTLAVLGSLYFAAEFVLKNDWPNITQLMVAIFGGLAKGIVNALTAGQAK